MTGLSPSETLRLARALEKTLPADTRKLAVLASFNADLLSPYLMVEAQSQGLPLRPWNGPFGQLEQMVMQDSVLWEQDPKVLWIAMRVQDMDPALLHRSQAMAPQELKGRLQEITGRLVELARSARQRSRACIFVSDLELAELRQARPFDVSNPEGLFHQIASANLALARALAELADVHLFDWSGAIAECGARTFADPKLWYLARIPFAAGNLPWLASCLVRAIRGALHPSVKALVLDLDNTLWSGVLGEDGPDGIKLGGDYPGNIFRDFQEELLGYRERGILLAIASKNEAALVETTLRTHPDMVLRPEHFTCIRANWEPKPSNVRAIADALNLGLDSILFIDDNPAERAQMAAELPMVRILELPPEPLGYLQALRDCPLLDQPRVSLDDLQRAERYRENATREAFRQEIQSVDHYLEQLGMVAEVGLGSPVELDRVHQLISKTNQFNLTTRRHGRDDVRAMAQLPGFRVAWLRLSDRFGDLGIVCVGILKDLGSGLIEIDTLLMSCRVMGRSVEDAFLAYLATLAQAQKGSRLRGVLIRTAKNTPVFDFYESRGFAPAASGQQGVHYFEKAIEPGAFPWPCAIRQPSGFRDMTHENS